MTETAASSNEDPLPRFDYFDYLHARQMGLGQRHGPARYSLLEERLKQRLFYNFRLPSQEARNFGGGGGGGDDGKYTGGIFNLAFNPDGSVLGAACEDKCVLLLDPNTRRTVHAITGAHDEAVNNIRFLDSRLFATCSDDTTVALWDARYLTKKLRLLEGHTSYVKNIEYSRR